MKANSKNIFNNNEFIFQDVVGDLNCGYRCTSLQIYGTEENYNLIRQQIYNYLHNKIGDYTDLFFQVNANILPAKEYIKKIKKDKCWMGNLEIFVLNKLYDADVLVFKKYSNDYITLYNIYEDIY